MRRVTGVRKHSRQEKKPQLLRPQQRRDHPPAPAHLPRPSGGSLNPKLVACSPFPASTDVSFTNKSGKGQELASLGPVSSSSHCACQALTHVSSLNNQHKSARRLGTQHRA